MENTNSPASSLVLIGVNSCLLSEVVRSDLLLSVNKMEKVGMLEEFESKCDFKINQTKKAKVLLAEGGHLPIGCFFPPNPPPPSSFLPSPLLLSFLPPSFFFSSFTEY